MDNTNNINTIDDNEDSENTVKQTRTTWIYTANLNTVREELIKRKLNINGNLTDLRNRLIRYIKGGWIPADFENNPFESANNNSTKMTDKTPFFKPSDYSGAIHENIDAFLNKYNRASSINNWTSEQKKLFLPIYLSDTALKFFENIELTNKNATWQEIEDALRLEFEPTAQKHMLRILLDKRKQLSDETITSYINDIESLCYRIDPKMNQSELVYTVMKGLKPDIARYVGMLNNNTVLELKNNLRKYESIEFIINGETTQTPDEIRRAVIKEHVNSIEDDNNKKQINTLIAQVSNLESMLQGLNFNKGNNNTPYYKYNNNYEKNYNNNSNQKLPNNNQYTPKIPYNNFNNNNRSNNNYNNNNRSNNNYNNNNGSNNNYNKKYNNTTNNQLQKLPKYNDNYNYTQRQNYNNNNYNKDATCQHCNRKNHTSSECKWKLICNICQKRYHTADTCYFNKQENQKNL